MALALLACARGTSTAPRPEGVPQSLAYAPFAVVELFTARACAGCAAAELHLAEISHEARRSGQHVMTLAFHVNYWDGGGQPDPFAQPRHTRRQLAYMRARGQTELYTPQMIVNGRDEFPGARRGRARAAIKAALARVPRVGVGIAARWVPRETAMVVNYAVAGASGDDVLNLALVESLPAEPPQLSHPGVVRAFDVILLASGMRGEHRLRLPPRVTRAKSQLIAFVQQRAGGEVVGAHSVNFEPE